MYYVRVKDLVPGMVLGEDLFTLDQNLLATKGTHITHYLIQYLECHGIFYVPIRSILPEE